MIARKKKTCANPECATDFIPAQLGQKVCGWACGLAIKDVNQEKARKSLALVERREIKVRKEKLKSRSDHMKEAQIAWNRYVRARDMGKSCASCGARPAQKLGGTMDCSHYRSVGSAPHMRFHLHNAAAACVRCNRNLSGNIVELRKGLVARIGEQKVRDVERDQSVRKFSIEYLRRLKAIFTKKAKRIERRYEETNSWAAM